MINQDHFEFDPLHVFQQNPNFAEMRADCTILLFLTLFFVLNGIENDLVIIHKSFQKYCTIEIYFSDALNPAKFHHLCGHKCFNSSHRSISGRSFSEADVYIFCVNEALFMLDELYYRKKISANERLYGYKAFKLFSYHVSNDFSLTKSLYRDAFQASLSRDVNFAKIGVILLASTDFTDLPALPDVPIFPSIVHNDSDAGSLCKTEKFESFQYSVPQNIVADVHFYITLSSKSALFVSADKICESVMAAFSNYRTSKHFFHILYPFLLSAITVNVNSEQHCKCEVMESEPNIFAPNRTKYGLNRWRTSMLKLALDDQMDYISLVYRAGPSFSDWFRDALYTLQFQTHLSNFGHVYSPSPTDGPSPSCGDDEVEACSNLSESSIFEFSIFSRQVLEAYGVGCSEGGPAHCMEGMFNQHASMTPRESDILMTKILSGFNSSYELASANWNLSEEQRRTTHRQGNSNPVGEYRCITSPGEEVAKASLGRCEDQNDESVARVSLGILRWLNTERYSCNPLDVHQLRLNHDQVQTHDLNDLVVQGPSRVVFITAIYGGYERFLKPFARQTMPADFICFSDNPNISGVGWEVDLYPYHEEAWLRFADLWPAPLSLNGTSYDLRAARNAYPNNKHPSMISKFYKMCFLMIPRLLDYDVVVWVDGTIAIHNERTAEIMYRLVTVDKRNIILFENTNVGGDLDHDVRQSANLERFLNTTYNGIAQPRQDVWGQYWDYLRLGYDRRGYWRSVSPRPDYGLWVGCFTAYDTRAPATVRFLETWYQHVVFFTTQDQISFSFVAQSLGAMPYSLPDHSVERGEYSVMGTYVWNNLYSKLDHGN